MVASTSIGVERSNGSVFGIFDSYVATPCAGTECNLNRTLNLHGSREVRNTMLVAVVFTSDDSICRLVICGNTGEGTIVVHLQTSSGDAGFFGSEERTISEVSLDVTEASRLIARTSASCNLFV